MASVRQVQQTWQEMLAAWPGYLEDTDGYEAQLQEDAAAYECRGRPPHSCATFLVTILWTSWRFAFVKVVMTAATAQLQPHGEAWVGVINTSARTCRYDLWLDGVHRTFSLRPGEGQLLLGTNAVPCVGSGTGGHSITATSLPYTFVYCILDNRVRHTLGASRWVVDGITIGAGTTADPTELPCLEEPWEAAAARKHEWLSVVKKELMQVSCHPTRLDQI